MYELISWSFSPRLIGSNCLNNWPWLVKCMMTWKRWSDTGMVKWPDIYILIQFTCPRHNVLINSPILIYKHHNFQRDSDLHVYFPTAKIITETFQPNSIRKLTMSNAFIQASTWLLLCFFFYLFLFLSFDNSCKPDHIYLSMLQIDNSLPNWSIIYNCLLDLSCAYWLHQNLSRSFTATKQWSQLSRKQYSTPSSDSVRRVLFMYIHLNSLWRDNGLSSTCIHALWIWIVLF